MLTKTAKHAFCLLFILFACSLRAQSQITWEKVYFVNGNVTEEPYNIVTKYSKEPFDTYISGEFSFILCRSILSEVQIWNANFSTMPSSGSDLTAESIEDLNESFDNVMAEEGIAYYQQAGEPAARYNCHAYAIGQTAYWIDNGDIYFYYRKYKTELTTSLNANTCGHGSGWFNVDHSSKVAMMPQTIPEGCEGAGTAIIVETYLGKFGISGRYFSDVNMPESYYQLDSQDRVYWQ